MPSTSTAREVDNRPWPLRYITAVIRCWGTLTFIGLWGCTVEIIKDPEQFLYVGWYVLAVSVLVTFFEIVWIINKSACCREEGCCCLVWKGLVWIDEWRKCILYLAFSVPCFLRGTAVFMGILAGLLLDILALLYLLKTFRYSECCQSEPDVEYDGVATNQTTSLMQSEVTTQTEDLEIVPQTVPSPINRMTQNGAIELPPEPPEPPMDE